MSSSFLVEADASPASARDPLIGVQLEGRYVIERVHGRGGTSIVYAGIHEELQAEVAIKVLDHAGAADPVAVERFALEARLGSSLAHGNVVGVSDFGHLPDGRPYLVMPMIAGIDMATLLAQEGPQHPRRVAKLLHGVASALSLMHARGLVHRDIKSENLMYVAHEDGTETALVLDFGIAAGRAPDAAAYADSSGTPEFMPPEALSGEISDYRGDIYALATVAFELITGSLPFEGEDLTELRHKKTTEPARTLAQVGEREFPAALEAVLARGLARRPADRHASASGFVAALETAAESMPAWSQRPAPRKRASTHPTLVGTGGSGVRDRAAAGVPVRGAAKPHASTRVPLRVNAVPRKDSERSETLKRLSERAARFSSSTPAPPPLGAVGPLSPVTPATRSATLRAPATLSATPRASATLSAALRKLVEAAAEPAPQAAPLADATSPTSPTSPLDAGASPAQRTTLARGPELDIDDEPFFLPRKRGARLLAYAALAGVLALVVWQRARPAVPPAASAASTPAPVHVEPLLPVEATTPAVPVTPAAPAVAAAAPSEPVVAAPNEDEVLAAQASVTHEAPRAATNSHSSHAASSKRKKTPASPVLKITKRSEPAAPSAAAPAPSKSSSSPRAKSGPERARALAEQATEATLRSDFAAAANLYQQAIAADPGYAPAWRGKALVFERTGRSHEAAAAFRQFLKLAPNGAAADKIRERLKMLEAAP